MSVRIHLFVESWMLLLQMPRQIYGSKELHIAQAADVLDVTPFGEHVRR